MDELHTCKAHRSSQARSKCQLPNVPTTALETTSTRCWIVSLGFRSKYSTSGLARYWPNGEWRCNYIVCNADRSCLDYNGGPPVQVFDSDDEADDDDNDKDNDDDGLSGLDWGPPVQFSHATTYAATGAFKRRLGKSFWYVVDCPTQL